MGERVPGFITFALKPESSCATCGEPIARVWNGTVIVAIGTVMSIDADGNAVWWCRRCASSRTRSLDAR